MVPTEVEGEQIYVNNLLERAHCLEGVFVCAMTKYKTKMKPCPSTSGPATSQAASFGDASDAMSTSAEEDSCALRAYISRSLSVGSTAEHGTQDDQGYLNGSPCVGRDPRDGDFVLSQGSLGHPHLCERACAYASAGRCMSGSQCSYCHIPHTAKTVHLDKRNRRMIQGMSFGERAAFMLPILERKAREHDFGPACESLLNLLASEAKVARGCEDARVSLPNGREFSRVMTAMTFNNVLRHLLTGLPSPAARIAPDVGDLLSTMRSYISSQTVREAPT